MEGKCFCCGKGGHKAPQCHHNNRPNEEWAISKAKSEEFSLSQIGNTTTSGNPKTDTNSIKNNNENAGTKGSVGWMVAHFNLLQIDEMKK